MKEKRFKLDLSAYTITINVRKEGQKELVEEVIDYPIRSNLSVWLRMAGMFRKAEDVAEAVSLAKQIRDAEEDYVILDEREAQILRSVIDRLLELSADGQMGDNPFGGELHEEVICRVVNMEEIEAG